MSDTYPSIRVVDRADPAAVRQLTDALYAFNAAATGIEDGRELFAELRDRDGELCAGVHGWALMRAVDGELKDYPCGHSDLLLRCPPP